MNNSQEYIVKSDGQIVRRRITEEQINITAASLDILTNSIVRTNWNIFQLKNPMAEMKGQPAKIKVHLFASAGFSYYTMYLPLLHIRAPHQIIKDENSGKKILVPNFEGDGLPVITTHWVPPNDYQMILAIKANENSFREAYLVTRDVQEGRCYRLPLGNLHSNCQICTGEDHETEFEDSFSMINYMLELFNNSQWNNDLVGGTDISDSQCLFRFEPTKDGFKQMPSIGTIPERSKKIAPSCLNFIQI